MSLYNGSIARIKKDGTNFDILTETYNEKFLVLEKDGIDYLIFDDTSVNSSKKVYNSMNLSNKEISITQEFLPEYLNVPFLEYKNQGIESEDNNIGYEYDISNGDILCNVYTDNKASKMTLIDENNFKKISGKLYINEEEYREIKNIQYTNSCVYFTVEEETRSEENDIGWRYSYKRMKTQIYQKNLKTSEMRIINSY